MQRLQLPGLAVAFADQADDAGTGRNPVYLALSGTSSGGPGGRVVRLQPVPVDTQVEQLLVGGAVRSAQEMLQNLTPQFALEAKLHRLNIDAGRTLFLQGCAFERAFAHLTASIVDPREVRRPEIPIYCYLSRFIPVSVCCAALSQILAMFPELTMGTRAVVAALKPERIARPPGSPHAQAADVASAYCFSARYFTPGLTLAVAQGSKFAKDAASEAADAASLQQMQPTVEQLRQSLSPAVVSALGATSAAGVDDGRPGVSLRVADVRDIISAGIANASKPRRPAAGAAGSELMRAGSADAQYRAALRALVRFLRRRRCVVEEAFECGSVAMKVAGDSTSGFCAAAGGPSTTVAGGGTSKPRLSPQQLQAFLVPESVGGRYATPACSAFEAAGRSVADIRGLRLAIDTALLRALLLLGQDTWLDRFVSHPVTLDMTDADSALRAAGRFSTLALLNAQWALLAPASTADIAALNALQARTISIVYVCAYC